MRMWLVPPEILCRKHLLGEHFELHKLVHAINKRQSIAGRVRLGHVDPYMIADRHAELVVEMTSRGYKHNSPLPLMDDPAPLMGNNRVCVRPERNIVDLAERCPDCAKRIRDHAQPVRQHHFVFEEV